jgi:hypothetical protein
MRIRHVLVTAAALLALAATAACGDDDDDGGSGDLTTEDYQEALCAEQDTMTLAIAELKAVDPATLTLSEISAISDQLRIQLDEISVAAEALAASEWNDLESAYEDLDATLDSVTGDDELGQIEDDVTASRDAISDAWAALLTASDCEPA